MYAVKMYYVPLSLPAFCIIWFTSFNVSISSWWLFTRILYPATKSLFMSYNWLYHFFILFLQTCRNYHFFSWESKALFSYVSTISLESSALTIRLLIIPEWSAISADSLWRTLCKSSARVRSCSTFSKSSGKSQLEGRSSNPKYSANAWITSPQRSISSDKNSTFPFESICMCSSWKKGYCQRMQFFQLLSL